VPSTIADGSFQVRRKLDEGCFGEVFSGTEVQSGDPVAIKLETTASSDLDREVQILKLLNKKGARQGIAKFYHFGR
jgi:casein kinase 1